MDMISMRTKFIIISNQSTKASFGLLEEFFNIKLIVNTLFTNHFKDRLQIFNLISFII